MTDSAELIAIIEPVARRLLGEPNRRASTKTVLRFGTHGSMSVDLAKGVWTDHEIGQGGGVLDLIERETGKKGPDRLQWLVDERLLANGHDRRQADPARARIVKTYPYHDEAGQLLFQVVRFDPKDFRQRRPDPTKPDGWNWSTTGVRKVPYRLPELIEAIALGKTVFIAEGERDVDRLASLGVPATTNPGGAGKWRHELTSFFDGANAVVIPDNDPQKKHPKTNEPMFHPDGRPVLPGQDHAQAVAAALSALAQVRVLDLSAVWPAMPLKGDVSDWLDRGGGSAEALYELAESLPSWPQRDRSNGAGNHEEPPDRGAPPVGEKRTPKKVKITRGSDIEPEKITWLWPGWLARGKLHILAGRPGSLKTTTAMDFAATETTGGQWPDGERASAGNVLVWSGEDAIDDTLLPRFMAAGGDRSRIYFISGIEENGKKRAFDPARDIESLVEVCEQIGDVALIIVDPIVAVAKGDSHKNAEARKDLQPLVDLAEKTQAAIIGIHHLTKRSEGSDPVDRVSGSLAFGAGPRVVLMSALDGKGTPEPRGFLMRAKTNIAPPTGGFEFCADTRPLDNYPHISAQRILWGAATTESARDILERIEGKAAKEEMSKRKIVAFLLGALQGRGPRMAAEVIAEGEDAGFSERALRRTFTKALGGRSEKASMKTGWIWELPEGESAPNVIPFPGGREGDDDQNT
jgi:putative DNA primase/helicase